MKHRLLALLLLAALPLPAFANGLILVDEPVDLPGIVLPEPIPRPRPPFPPHPPIPPRPILRHLPLELKRQQVEIEIRDQIASTEVLQVFSNPTSRRFEGTFIFPLPAGAHISEFAMEVNGKLVEAELLDASKARQIYEDIVRRSLDPALFEYAGRALFKVRIFPIEPHSTKEVRVRYQELLSKDGSMVRYAYPLNTAKYSRTPIPDFSLRIDLRCGDERSLKSIYSPSHDFEIVRKGEHHAVLGLEAARLDPTEDLQVYFSSKPADGSLLDADFLATHPAGSKDPGHFLLLLSPAAWNDAAPPAPKDVVFVFDSSGSMRGENMKQAQAALDFCIGELHPEDRFEVVRFSTEAEPVFNGLVSATPEHRERALKFISEVRAIGGTAIEEALTTAMKTAAAGAEAGRPSQILFLTDGKPTLGATREEVILQNLARVQDGLDTPIRVFSFGIGTEINTTLLDLITEQTRAVSEFVLPDENIEEKVSRFFAKISDPVLTGLELQWEGIDWIRSRYPKDLPDLFRGDQLVVLGQFPRDAQEGRVTLRGRFRAESRSFSFPVQFAAKGDSSNAFVAKLWATRRVGYLLEQIRLHGESAELKEEVAELARRWGIVTPYTSFLIVEDEMRRGVPLPMQTQAPSPRASSAPGADAFADLGAEYEALKTESEGGRAVAGAAASKQLKESRRAGSVSEANAIADRARGNQYDLTVNRTIAGKTFYQQGPELWIDQEAQALGKPKPDRIIRFASPEYFDLLAGNLELTQWLSVSPRLQVVVADELLEIVN